MNGGSADQIDVYRLRLDLPPDRIEAFASQLTADELARADRLLSGEKRREFIVTRANLRRLLAEYTGEAPERIRITHQVRGKPGLAGDGQRLRFSVSHSHELALIAIGLDREIGVDVEKTRDDIDHLMLARRFFSDAEYAALSAMNDPVQQRRAFFSVWTRKEAIVKAHGGGIALGLRNFDVSVEPALPPRVLATRWPEAGVPEWRLIDIDAGPEYAACLACDSDNIRLNLQDR